MMNGFIKHLLNKLLKEVVPSLKRERLHQLHQLQAQFVIMFMIG
jgi:hypothetical protein